MESEAVKEILDNMDMDKIITIEFSMGIDGVRYTRYNNRNDKYDKELFDKITWTSAIITIKKGKKIDVIDVKQISKITFSEKE